MLLAFCHCLSKQSRFRFTKQGSELPAVKSLLGAEFHPKKRSVSPSWSTDLNSKDRAAAVLELFPGRNTKKLQLCTVSFSSPALILVCAFKLLCFSHSHWLVAKGIMWGLCLFCWCSCVLYNYLSLQCTVKSRFGVLLCCFGVGDEVWERLLPTEWSTYVIRTLSFNKELISDS